MDPTIDRELSEHVIKSHQYRRPGTVMEPEPLNQSSSLNLDEDEIELLETPVWQRGVEPRAAMEASRVEIC